MPAGCAPGNFAVRWVHALEYVDLKAMPGA